MPRTAGAFALLALLPLLWGCPGSTEPSAPFEVTFTPSATAKGAFVLVNGATRYACSFPLSISAIGGRSGDKAGWEGGTVTVRVDANGGLTSSFFQSADATTWFGRSSITAGQSFNGPITVLSSGSYTATLVFNYSVFNPGKYSDQYGDRSATASLRCQ